MSKKENNLPKTIEKLIEIEKDSKVLGNNKYRNIFVSLLIIVVIALAVTLAILLSGGVA